MATKKPENKKEKAKEPTPKEEKELEEKYAKVFKKVVEAIQEEENVAITYQVLVDILTQLEQHIKSQMGGCSHDCGSCHDCNHDE
jgi:cytochrome c556